jgi:flagellar biogenesis protein FliO
MKATAITGTTLFTLCLASVSTFAEATNAPGGSLMPTDSDSGLPSLIRVAGAFLLVIGIFLGGVWFFRNWQRLGVQRGTAPRLNILEMRSLGGRQAIYVVGYEQERFLVASSPAGVNLLSHLPAAAEGEAGAKSATAPSFAEALKQVLKGR